jgi:PKD repeat protein
MKLFTAIFTLVLFSVQAFAQPSIDYAIPLKAEVNSNPPSITIKWENDTTATGYTLHQKKPNDFTWSKFLGTFSPNDSMFTDTNVIVGVGYEYRITKSFSGKTAYSYIYAGIDLPARESNGIILLLIDSLIADTLKPEISTLTEDLVGDGWEVKTILAGQSQKSAQVRTKIIQTYNEDKVNTNALLILGHVPVPYSGNIGPDGHSNHIGAWPADVFYADMNGKWTDQTVNTTSPSDPRNDNVPGDGKYDQSFIASNVELQVGRIDFANMPEFSQSEIELLRRYLNRDHAFRQKQFTAVRRALVDDNFGGFKGEAFAANAWRNFPLMVGSDSIFKLDYRTEMDRKSYLWSYGCGGGSYTSANGIGKTSDFAGDSLQTIFTFLFGSYFGDWDKKNNFLRAAVAQGTTLINAWAGRPNWHLHHMAMGYNIGYSARLTQNASSSLYKTNYGARMVHTALMGDPTLKADIVAPPSLLTATYNNGTAELNWTASKDAVLGYYIYRSTEPFKGFQRIHTEIISDTSFTDSCMITADTFYYMVRAIVLEKGFAGTFYNLSQGIFDSMVSPVDIIITAGFSFTQNRDTVSFTNTSQNATTYFWNFGDGESSNSENPVHVYDSSGTYTVTLITDNGCATDTFDTTVNVIITGIDEKLTTNGISVYPNPTDGVINIIGPDINADTKVQILNYAGGIIYNGIIGIRSMLDISGYPAGVYFVKVFDDEQYHMIKVIKP